MHSAVQSSQLTIPSCSRSARTTTAASANPRRPGKSRLGSRRNAVTTPLLTSLVAGASSASCTLCRLQSAPRPLRRGWRRTALDGHPHAAPALALGRSPNSCWDRKRIPPRAAASNLDLRGDLGGGLRRSSSVVKRLKTRRPACPHARAFARVSMLLPLVRTVKRLYAGQRPNTKRSLDGASQRVCHPSL